MSASSSTFYFSVHEGHGVLTTSVLVLRLCSSFGYCWYRRYRPRSLSGLANTTPGGGMHRPVRPVLRYPVREWKTDEDLKRQRE